MQAISEYLLSVTAAGVLCAIVRRLLEGRGAAAEAAKMLTGIFMVLAVVSPVTKVRLPDIADFLPELSAVAAVAQGEAAASNALRDGISARVEAYILDKAESLGLSLTVEVALSADAIPVPVELRLQGNASPYLKQKLQSILCENLAVDKENIIWT